MAARHSARGLRDLSTPTDAISLPSAALDEARRAIAEKLREIRRDAGLTGREVAARASWQPSKVSRLQSATTPPSDDDLRAWCRACGAEDQLPDLLAANRTADSMYLEWRRVQRSGLRRLQESRIPLYERTRTFRVYSSTVIPGFVQTYEYAAALLATSRACTGRRTTSMMQQPRA